MMLPVRATSNRLLLQHPPDTLSHAQCLLFVQLLDLICYWWVCRSQVKSALCSFLVMSGEEFKEEELCKATREALSQELLPQSTQLQWREETRTMGGGVCHITEHVICALEKLNTQSVLKYVCCHLQNAFSLPWGFSTINAIRHFCPCLTHYSLVMANVQLITHHYTLYHCQEQPATVHR